MMLPLLSVPIRYEEDVVAARQRTRELAELLGFDTRHQTRLATAVSEIARNAFIYAGGGTAEFVLDGSTTPQSFLIRVVDEGQGIANLDAILAGTYRSQTGMGLGIVGSQRLMDSFRIESKTGKGTVVVLSKVLPPRTPFLTPKAVAVLREGLAQQKPKTVFDEIREQNQELLRTMEELRRRQDELSALNRELEDTNRGVVALYAEVDEKANHLRHANEMKSRFFSNMSHEFRTPLNSIQALSRLLIDRTDGELTAEQEIQISFIRKSAESLSDLVNDLLDNAKIEAGKIDIRPSRFEVTNLFGALRGMLKPLLSGNTTQLIFGNASAIPPMYSDEAKISQILRNFVSNALKFTEAGEICVSAEYDETSGFVTFEVHDTGIGIAPEHRDHVFEEFTQLDSHLQRKVRGTGLGLPLSRKLAELLGGGVSLRSELGVGSTFSLRIPCVLTRGERVPSPALGVGISRRSILLVEDHYETRLAYEKHLRSSEWNVVSARSGREADSVLTQSSPLAIILDIRRPTEESWELLARLKAHSPSGKIPVIVATADEFKARWVALGADEVLPWPVNGKLLEEVLRRVMGPRARTVLVVDDEEASRYLTRQLFSGVPVQFREAKDGAQALDSMRASRPDLVMMDLVMPTMNGVQAIEAMQADTGLRGIPVVVSTSTILTQEEAAHLAKWTIAVLPKSRLLEAGTAEILGAALAAAGLADLHRTRELPGRAM